MNREREDGHPESATNPGALSHGQRVGHYRIVRNLASGGMGQVYLAYDTKLNRQVALKFLNASAHDSQGREQILNEARAAAQLNHPNVVGVHSVEEFNGRWFVALEFVDGGTLEQELTSGPIEVPRVINIGLQLCAGLAAAHELGIVHRDIKPANVLITAKNVVKIADFGVAATPDRGTDSGDGSSAGTLAYMSPELALGGKIDSRSDLFSLGVLLYEMIIGRRPFQGGYRASLEYSIINDTPESIKRVRPDAPSGLVKVIERLLEKSPDSRYQTAVEVTRDLATLGDVKPTTVDHFTPKARTRFLTLFLAGVALVLAGYWIIDRFTPEGTGPSGYGRLRIAVLPFENLGPPDDEYFSDGITDAITTHLFSLRDLAVISRTSAMQYKQTDKTIPEISSELQVDYVLIGTLNWERTAGGNHVVIRPQLIRASDDTYVWTESYDRVLESLFVLQSEIAEKVARALNVSLLEPDKQSIARAPTDNLEAYDWFLRGMAHFHRSWQRSDIEKAAEMFERAIALDTSFALAYAMLGRADASMYQEYYDRSAERLQRAAEAVATAVRLQPELPESHIARGYLFYHGYLDYDSALVEFAKARRLQPDNGELLNAIAAVKRRMGHLDAALEDFKLALALDPRDHLKALDIALTSGMLHGYDTAMVYAERALQLEPGLNLAHIFKAWIHLLGDGNVDAARGVLESAESKADLSANPYYWWLVRLVYDPETGLERSVLGSDSAQYYLYRGQIYRLMERSRSARDYYDSARIILENQVSVQPDAARFRSQLGLAYAGLGRFEDGVREGAHALELLPSSLDAFDAPFLAVNFAELCVMAGLYKDAIDQLEFLISMPGFVTPAYLKLDPIWDPIRGDPRFIELCNQPST